MFSSLFCCLVVFLFVFPSVGFPMFFLFFGVCFWSILFWGEVFWVTFLSCFFPQVFSKDFFCDLFGLFWGLGEFLKVFL